MLFYHSSFRLRLPQKNHPWFNNRLRCSASKVVKIPMVKETVLNRNASHIHLLLFDSTEIYKTVLRAQFTLKRRFSCCKLATYCFVWAIADIRRHLLDIWDKSKFYVKVKEIYRIIRLFPFYAPAYSRCSRE